MLVQDVQWEVHGPLLSGVYKGHDGVTEFFTKLAGVTDMRELVLDEELMLRDVVKMAVHVTGHETGFMKEDQKPYTNQFDHTFWFNDQGEITKGRVNWNLSF